MAQDNTNENRPVQGRRGNRFFNSLADLLWGNARRLRNTVIIVLILAAVVNPQGTQRLINRILISIFGTISPLIDQFLPSFLILGIILFGLRIMFRGITGRSRRR